MAEKPTHEEINQKRMLPKASLPQWQTTFDAINDAVCLLDMNGKILRCNKAMQSLLKKSSEEIIGGTCWELVHGTDKPVKGCPIVRMKKTLRRETLVLKVDDKWFNVSVDPVIDETGNLTSAVHIISDITRHKQAEETQRESEEKYRALYENTPLSYQALNENGCFNDVNSAWVRTLGYDRKEVIGKWFGDFLHPEWKPHFEKNFSEFKRRGYVHDAQFKIRHKDGHFLDISFEGSIGYHPDGSFKQTYCVFQDITERKKAENALRESENRLNTIFESAPDAYYINDFEGVFIEGNKAAEELVGYSREELIGKNFVDAGLLSMDEVEKAVKLLAENINGNFTGPEEFTLKRKDGTKVNVEILNHPVKIGGEDRVLGIARDITKRKQAEEEIRLHAAMMDNVAEGIYLVGLDDLIIKWTNEKFERMFGYDPREMVGKQVDIVNAPTEKTPPETWISIVDVLKETGEWHGEVRNIKRDGTHFWCYANVSLFDHPEYGKVVVSVHTDITERKQAEEELIKNEKLYKEAQSLAHMGHWDYESYEDSLFWSDELYSIFEIDKDAGPLSIEDFLERIHPEDRDIIREQVKKGENYRSDYRIVMDNGSVKHIHEEVLIERQEDGKIVLIRGTAQDITERKQAEEELHKRMNELETFYRTTLGREERIIELKQEVNELLEQLGKNNKYRDYS